MTRERRPFPRNCATRVADMTEPRSDTDHVEVGEVESEQESELPDGKSFPHIRQLAEMLELPTNVSNEELRQMIEGKLADWAESHRMYKR